MWTLDTLQKKGYASAESLQIITNPATATIAEMAGDDIKFSPDEWKSCRTSRVGFKCEQQTWARETERLTAWSQRPLEVCDYGSGSSNNRDQSREREQTVDSPGVWFQKRPVLISQCVPVGDRFSFPRQNPAHLQRPLLRRGSRVASISCHLGSDSQNKRVLVLYLRGCSSCLPVLWDIQTHEHSAELRLYAAVTMPCNRDIV